MAKLAYQRLDDILGLLMQRTEPISIQELSNTNHVTERTIRSDINNLNELLQPIDASISLIRNKGYQLNITSQSAFDHWWKENLAASDTFLSSAEERQTLLLFILFKSQTPYTLENFLDQLFVSKNTFYSYLKAIRDALLSYGLKVINRPNIGFEIVGDEFAKRQAIIDLLIGKDLQEYLTGFTEMEFALFDNVDLEQLEKIELYRLSGLGLLESDYYHRNMLTHFALGISRVLDHQIINEFPVKVPDLFNKATHALHRLIQDIEEKYEITLPNEEKKYFTYYLALNSPRLVNVGNEQIDSQKTAQAIVHKLLERIKASFNFDWTDDQLLIDDLISHIKGFINMNVMDAGHSNPLLTTIKRSFPLAYDLCLTSLKEIGEQYGLYFSEDEIGYIALHIAGAFERNSIDQIHKYRVILVCGTGKAMSRIIEAKIKNVYKEQISILERLSFVELQKTDVQSIDFVITTVPLGKLSIPYIYIDMTYLDTEIRKIDTHIKELEKQKQTIEQLFDPRFFFYEPKETSKVELLKDMSEELEKENIVPQNFYASIMEREKIEQTGIGQTIAIPHPMSLIAQESKLAVAIIPEGIDWGKEEQVNFVFLFAIKKEDYEETAEIYDLLVDLLNDTQTQQNILKNNDFDCFLNQMENI
ncbi:MAG: BglG family transcription antiterminator [Tetragenococcus koreensis]|nr:BglG family transcription antiterminator [Tetragenococcus koreensis]